MGHHFNEKRQFQSDKHPEMPPDRIRQNLENPLSLMSLRVLAADYQEEDGGFAADLLERLEALHGPTQDQTLYAYAQGLLEGHARDGSGLGRGALKPALRLLSILSGIPLTP